MIKIITTSNKFIRLRKSSSFFNKPVGFVPTMGALHDGHISLIRKFLKQNDITVVSIYFNPTQSNSLEDLKNYPKTYQQDIKILKALNVDYLFYPGYSEIYPDDFTYKIIETNSSKMLYGKFRQGHF